MRVIRIHSYNEFMKVRGRLDREYQSFAKVESELSTQHKGSFSVPAFSYTASKWVNLHAHMQNQDINWRETLVCPETGLNNRIRAAVQVFEFELAPDADSLIYLSEQTTSFYKFLSSRYKNTIGSEYLSPAFVGGYINDAGIRHEDMTALSFPEGSIDYCISLECFEHIPDYQKAFESCAKVIRPGGALYISVPFILHNEKNLIRAYVNENNEIVHVLPPEYHGNPIDPEGCLCFTVFGWEMLDQLKQAGFSQAYALLYWSQEFGYLGGHQVAIIAIK